MARLIGPDEASRKVEAIDSSGRFVAKRNRPATVYANAAATQLADILTVNGEPYAGSVVTTDAYSMLPLFQFPDGVDILWVVVDGGPAWPIYARTDDRLDTLSTGVSAAETMANADARVARIAAAARYPRRPFASDFAVSSGNTLLEWTSAHTGTNTSHSVATSANPSGGNVLSLVDTEPAGLALVRSQTFDVPQTRPCWYTIDHVTVSGTGEFEFTLNAGSSRRATIKVTGPSTVQLNAGDSAGLQTVTNVNAGTGFLASRAFRLAIWFHPVTGEARFYIYYETGGVTRHVYMGSRTCTLTPFPPTVIQLNTGHATQTTATVARAEVWEVAGVLHGASTDTPHNAWDQAPSKFPTQDRHSDSAGALAARLWGARGGIVNQAHGGWTLDNMLNGIPSSTVGEATATWANMVTALEPRIVILGSAVNSLAAATTLGVPSAEATAAVEAAKVTYLQLIDESFEAGAELVIARTVAPLGGHVTFDTSAKLDLIDDWNEWMRSTLPSLHSGRVVISDVYAAMVNPNVPRTMLPIYDIGDHIHFTRAGGELITDLDARAIFS